MSHQQSSKHGPVVDDALQDERHAPAAGTRHAAQVDDEAEADPHTKVEQRIAEHQHGAGDAER